LSHARPLPPNLLVPFSTGLSGKMQLT
jgi:hypothetical protein